MNTPNAIAAAPAPAATFSSQANAAGGAVAGGVGTPSAAGATTTYALPTAAATLPPYSYNSTAATNATIASSSAQIAANSAAIGGGPVSASGSASGSSAGSGASASSGGASSTLNPWSVSSQLYRVQDVSTVTDDFEPQRTYSYIGGNLAITLNVQKQSGASEVSVSENVQNALPRLAQEYPQIHFEAINVQADYSQQQITAVFHTLFSGVLFTGIVMLLFLGSWRNAIVVLIAIPSSIGITLGLMKIFGFTIDTISLLAMTLIIGILVDDSIVVLENITHHFDDGESPQTAAILGRTEIGNAAIVITLVDVVVFLPIAFLPGIVGRFLSEFGLVVVAATLTSLAISFTVTPSLAGNWSLFSRWRPWAPLRAFTRGFERVRGGFYTDRVSGVGAAPSVHRRGLVARADGRGHRARSARHRRLRVHAPRRPWRNLRAGRFPGGHAADRDQHRHPEARRPGGGAANGTARAGRRGRVLRLVRRLDGARLVGSGAHLPEADDQRQHRSRRALLRPARAARVSERDDHRDPGHRPGRRQQPADRLRASSRVDRRQAGSRTRARVYEALLERVPGTANVNSSVMSLTPQVDIRVRSRPRAGHERPDLVGGQRRAHGVRRRARHAVRHAVRRPNTCKPSPSEIAQNSVAAISQVPVRTQSRLDRARRRRGEGRVRSAAAVDLA